MPELVLHGLAPSHPCMTAEAALRLKGLSYERIDFTPGEHIAKMAALYGDAALATLSDAQNGPTTETPPTGRITVGLDGTRVAVPHSAWMVRRRICRSAC